MAIAHALCHVTCR